MQTSTILQTNQVPISVVDITKTYRRSFRRSHQSALRNVSFDIRPGEIFSLLGSNGAGKTTLVRILLGFIFPDSGNTLIQGQSSTTKESRKGVGYLPERVYCPPGLTPMEFLSAWGVLSGFSVVDSERRAAELLDRLSLGERRNSKIREFSKGMVLRLGFAQALISHPNVLILDEPTDGLDAGGRLLFREILLELKARGTTVLMNSHLLSEVEKISDRVGVISKGRLVRTDRVDDITRHLEEFKVSFQTESKSIADRLSPYHPIELPDRKFEVSVSHSHELERVLGLLRDAGAKVISIDQKKMSIEDYFVSVAEE